RDSCLRLPECCHSITEKGLAPPSLVPHLRRHKQRVKPLWWSMATRTTTRVLDSSRLPKLASLPVGRLKLSRFKRGVSTKVLRCQPVRLSCWMPTASCSCVLSARYMSGESVHHDNQVVDR